MTIDSLPTANTTKFRWLIGWGVAAATLVGIWLRTAHIGEGGIPGDELELWRFCKTATSAWSILAGQIQHPMDKLLPAYIRGFQDWFHLPLSPFSLRLPGAILGIFCIPMIYLAGIRFIGRRGALLAAWLLALSPVHIQCSTEAYPYILSSSGFAIGLWCVLRSLDAALAHERCPWMLHPLLLLAMIFMMYASMAAWPLAVLVGAAFAGTGLLRLRASRQDWPTFAIASAVFLVTVAPRVWLFISTTLAKRSAHYDQAASHAGGIALMDPAGFRFVTNFAWGSTPLRAALTVIVLILTVLVIWRRRREWAVWTVVGFVGVGFLATMVSRYITGNPFWSRFLVPLMPAYVLLLAAGAMLPYGWVAGRAAWGAPARLAVSAGWTLVLLIPLVAPALEASRIHGPFPYRGIVAWADANFRPGTPVLCDRFFDAYNEFLVNPSTGVVFTATIPNEPFERFEQENWRQTAIEFLQNNPDAPLYEAHMYELRIGRWDWPQQAFAHHIPFLDEHYARLERMGLTYRNMDREFTLETFAREIHYNTTEDILARARAGGRSGLSLYGEGWTYAKTQDYRDWRVLSGRAALDVYNLGTVPRPLSLRLFAIAAQGEKRVHVPGIAPAVFPANRGVQLDLGPFTLPPGRSTLVLEDPQWPAQQAVLLVQKIDVIPKDEPKP